MEYSAVLDRTKGLYKRVITKKTKSPKNHSNKSCLFIHSCLFSVMLPVLFALSCPVMEGIGAMEGSHSLPSHLQSSPPFLGSSQSIFWFHAGELHEREVELDWACLPTFSPQKSDLLSLCISLTHTSFLHFLFVIADLSFFRWRILKAWFAPLLAWISHL